MGDVYSTHKSISTEETAQEEEFAMCAREIIQQGGMHTSQKAKNQ